MSAALYKSYHYGHYCISRQTHWDAAAVQRASFIAHNIRAGVQ